MNKQALKLKQKRRLQRQIEKSEKINKVWNDMSSYIERTGLRQLEKTDEHMLKVYRITKNIQKQIFSKSAIIALTCSLLTAHDCYNFDTEDLLRYSKRLQRFITTTVSKDRPILKVTDEIEIDYKVSIFDRCKQLPKVNINTSNKNDLLIRSTVENFPYMIGISAYTFMNDLVFTKDKSWNSDDLECFISKSFDLYSHILIDSSKLESYRNILLNICNINVNLNNGNVSKIINKGEKL